ncbi:hypothetical protein FRC19_003904 [Serendipita sp. 401]|nr:hypothetical protein FRC15_009144 [Serendipita sp. 397]KAG8828565.1 hypothetical protein FRC19_003904 [Serendipita sp. 401]KAG8865963.1 hypothetical protein FRC20_009233 [Serendipita sp. 405]KAG9058561.1 hypothetical protein FS842_007983 [Serendipita sp. 407]
MALFFGFLDVLYVPLLLVNAIAILNEERFLARIGWSASQTAQQTYNGYDQIAEESIKARLINLIAAVRTLLRIPLIGLNVFVIIYELLLGS